MLDQEQILEALRTVENPGSAAARSADSENADTDIVSAGMISGLQLSENGEVLFMIEVDPEQGAKMEPLRQKAEQAVLAIKNVRKVTAILTAERKNAPANDGAADPHGMAKNPKLDLPIKKIIAVASGKGGVGKSTLAANIAINLAKNSQLKIGLLDADIYGPSQPKMFGLEGYKPAFTDEKQIIPPEAFGVKMMSIGFMVEAEKALVWRGPMVQTAVYQLFRDVDWTNGLIQNEESEEAALDVLIVDMPPGTGDAQLTLAQKVPVTGAIIVSTPQDIALADARKGVEMFQAVNVPILGVIENMSTHICSNCGHEEHIFGHGGARKEAEKLGVPFLGEIPLSADIRAKSDAGQPFDLDEAMIEALLEAI
ncbi:MAG: Mrp/NBP35 family ATP-binding protein [Pseudomonadota bacterium]